MKKKQIHKTLEKPSRLHVKRHTTTTWYIHTQSASLESTWNGEKFNNNFLRTGERMEKIHRLMRGWRVKCFAQKPNQEGHQEGSGVCVAEADTCVRDQ